MKNAIIYPYNDEILPIIVFNEELKNTNIVDIVSYKGWGYENRKIKCVHREFVINENLEKALAKCDTILSFIPNKLKDFTLRIDELVEVALCNNKNLILLNRVEKDKKEYYKEIFSDKKLEFCNYSNDEEHVSVNDLVLTEEYNKLLPINTPIISVAGMGNKTDKYFIQLYLKKYFKERNYKLDLVSTKHYGGILGDIPMPSFLFSENIFETNKVFLFNRFIKIIEQKNNPDLIILGIPNSVLPLNNDNSDGFGIIPFLIFQAVKPDYSILSLYYDDYTKKYYEEIDLLMKYRFGSEIDCFNISNTRLDWMNLENETTRYLSINNFSNAIDVINKMKKYNYKNIININRFNFNEIGFYIETQLKKHANINIF